MVFATENYSVVDKCLSGYETASRDPSVLYVDDDPLLISSVQRSFRSYRVRLEVAFHGMQGVVNAVETRPDIIVTDLQMPFASGEELVDCLSRHPATAGVPILVVTGRAGVSLTAKFRRLGVKNVLSKPLCFENLLDELRAYIPIRLRE